MLDRKIVVVQAGPAPLAICVDQVRDPEEFARSAVFAPPGADGAGAGPLRGIVSAMVRTSEGAMPVLDPAALVSPRLLRRLPSLALAAHVAAG